MIRKFVNVLRGLCATFPWISHEIWLGLGVYLQKLCLMQSSSNSIVFREEWFVLFFYEDCFLSKLYWIKLISQVNSSY